MARSEGFEPPTLGIEIRCSIQLSYERGGRGSVPPAGTFEYLIFAGAYKGEKAPMISPEYPH